MSITRRTGNEFAGYELGGAAWRAETLVEQDLKDIVDIHNSAFNSACARPIGGRSFKCPVPVLGRQGSDSRVFEILLPSGVPSDHWILRGVAMSLARRLGEH